VDTAAGDDVVELVLQAQRAETAQDLGLVTMDVANDRVAPALLGRLCPAAAGSVDVICGGVHSSRRAWRVSRILVAGRRRVSFFDLGWLS
jgi:hypothetical protein